MCRYARNIKYPIDFSRFSICHQKCVIMFRFLWPDNSRTFVSTAWSLPTRPSQASIPSWLELLGIAGWWLASLQDSSLISLDRNLLSLSSNDSTQASGLLHFKTACWYCWTETCYHRPVISRTLQILDHSILQIIHFYVCFSIHIKYYI